MLSLSNKNSFRISAFLLPLLVFPTVAYAAGYNEAGFWSGLWHGVTFFFRIFLKLLWTDLTIYEQFNSIYLYHVGFLVGILVMIGGGSRAAT